MTQKRQVNRPFPPDFVSAETLAYRLDYARSTVDDYVRRGLLPKPVIVGVSQRWYWPEVLKAVFDCNGRPFTDTPTAETTTGTGDTGSDGDPYSEGIRRG